MYFLLCYCAYSSGLSIADGLSIRREFNEDIECISRIITVILDAFTKLATCAVTITFSMDSAPWLGDFIKSRRRLYIEYFRFMILPRSYISK